MLHLSNLARIVQARAGFLVRDSTRLGLGPNVASDDALLGRVLERRKSFFLGIQHLLEVVVEWPLLLG